VHIKWHTAIIPFVNFHTQTLASLLFSWDLKHCPGLSINTCWFLSISLNLLKPCPYFILKVHEKILLFWQI
jgi:hypothetical protein